MLGKQLIKDFRFSSIENIKSNIALFDDDLRILKMKEEQEKGHQLISSLETGNINSIFQSTNQAERKEAQTIPSELEHYFEMIQKRFTQNQI